MNKPGRDCQAQHMQSADFSEEEKMTQEVGVGDPVTEPSSVSVSRSPNSPWKGAKGTQFLPGIAQVSFNPPNQKLLLLFLYFGEKIECSREAAYVGLSLKVIMESENYMPLSHPEFPAVNCYSGEQYIRPPTNPTHVLHPTLNQTTISSTKHQIKQWTCISKV